MKKHLKLLRLIVVTAVLVAIGVFGYKYMRTYNNIERGYQSDQIKDATFDQTQQDEVLEQIPVDVSDEVVIQKENPNAQKGYCLPGNSTCSSSTQYCCRPFSCTSGYCGLKMAQS